MFDEDLSLIVDNRIVSLSHHASNKFIVDISDGWSHKVFDMIDIIELLLFVPQSSR